MELSIKAFLSAEDFKENEMVLYQNGDSFEVGKIKRLCNDGAFVWYNSGDTAAKTPYENLHKLQNAYCLNLCQGMTLPELAPVIRYAACTSSLFSPLVTKGKDDITAFLKDLANQLAHNTTPRLDDDFVGEVYADICSHVKEESTNGD
jgi:hypothetical protein